MATPTPEVFFIYNASGVPVTGAAGTMSFDYYGTEAGVAITPQPAITEIGGGAYKFTPAAPPVGHGLVYVLNTGATHFPARWARFFRVEDYYPDQILDIQSFLEGKWEIKTTGPDANRMIFYQPDGVTVLKKFDLFDRTGAPTQINPMIRQPV